MVRIPWKAGAAAPVAGRVYVSATCFRYRSLADLPAVSWHALRLRAGWTCTDGAVGMAMAADWLQRTTYSLSVWTSEAALRRWLATPDHVRLVRDFRARLEAAESVGWWTERFSLDDAWPRALQQFANGALANARR